MKTEQELKDQCTPEFIKWMCELAEGFKCLKTSDDYEYISLPDGFRVDFDITKIPNLIFPLLIHRAVEGWNKININVAGVYYLAGYVENHGNNKEFHFANYQPQSLTQAECAMIDCLLDIFKEERK